MQSTSGTAREGKPSRTHHQPERRHLMGTILNFLLVVMAGTFLLVLMMDEP